ncbi:hypothetical protein EOK75_03290 [Pseudorhodobacter turbinis]|uniref:D-galactarate dehydratase n=1 Tax=Pseudorhodobacter turbinis TaxID=2500533 RepID=A0A4P8EE48_9RHOB|nr:hypothetical protein [Pseudorhodobacter turbinis]QCO54893.1 hypothetical protein EOK75_03290 [Pseudorhodobacter turbinis]
MKHISAALIPALLVLSACASLPFGKADQGQNSAAATEQRPQARPLSQGVTAPPQGARTAAALDTTTAAQKAAVLAPAKSVGEQALGKTAVGLGNVTEPGFWLRSALVTSPGAGRVVTAGGASIAVDLIPGEGAAQLSLAAFRALNLSLTDLPEVTIYAQ